MFDDPIYRKAGINGKLFGYARQFNCRKVTAFPTYYIIDQHLTGAFLVPRRSGLILIDSMSECYSTQNLALHRNAVKGDWKVRQSHKIESRSMLFTIESTPLITIASFLKSSTKLISNAQ